MPRMGVAALRGWLVDHLAPAGYDVRIRRPNGRWASRSWCNPVTRRILLRHDVDLESARGVALLAHEVTHARQQAGPWWYRWTWGARYLLDPWFRRAVEIEGEAWWAAVMVWLDGVHVVKAARMSHTLGGWRSPHYTPGEPDDMTERIAHRTREILE